MIKNFLNCSFGKFRMSDSPDPSNDQYLTYGKVDVGFGNRPAVVVVDFQRAFTDAAFEMGGAPLIERAVENTQRLLASARAAKIPVVKCVMGYGSEQEQPHWKVTSCRNLILGNAECEVDPRIHEPEYDMTIVKNGPSIFFKTPVVTFFIGRHVDTIIVTGCVTSGCVRASITDSFQYGFRTIVPEDCVGDHHEQPHKDNLRDIERRYADISNADAIIEYFNDLKKQT